MGLISNVEQGVGGLIGSGIRNFGNAVTGTAANFGRGLINGLMPPQKQAPVDAPVPPGIANFKMGTTAKTPDQNVTPPSNTLPNGAAKVANSPQSTSTSSAAPSYLPIAERSVQYNPATTITGTGTTISPTQNNNGIWGSVVSNLANTQPSTATTQAQNNLNNIGLYGSPEVNKAMQQEQGLMNQQGSIATGNSLAAVDAGRAANVQTSINSAAQLLANAQAQQTNQINAANNAGNLANTAQQNVLTGQATAQGATQPQADASFFGSPELGGPVGQGGGLIQSNVQNAIAQANAGGDKNAIGQQLLSSSGLLAYNAYQSALNQQSGGSYNPTAQSASAQQTASQGAATGGEAYNLNIALNQLNTLKPVISNFLSTSGINPTDSKLYNAPINTYISTLGNPAATQQYNTMLNDLQNFSSQIVSSGTALTPTGVTAATELQDPSSLSMAQINYYLNTLDTLGQNRYSVLSKAAQDSGYTGYTGGAGNISTSTQVAPPSNSPGSGIVNPTNQAVAGVGLGVGSWALSQAQHLGPPLAGFIAGEVAK